MNLSAIKNAVTSTAARKVLLTQKHSPAILFAGGLVGIVTTVVLASRATLQLQDVVEAGTDLLDEAKATFENEAYPEYDQASYRQDSAIIGIRTAGSVVRLYGPALLVGLLSVAALTGSHKILSDRNAGLAAAYAALDKGYKEYRKRVSDAYGPERELELRHGTEDVTELVEGKNGKLKEVVTKQVAAMPSIYARFFDQLSPEWNNEAEYNASFLHIRQSWANQRLHSRGHLFLNEVYDSLGIPRSKAGQCVGWVLNHGDEYVDFGLFEQDSERIRDFVNGREAAILLDFNVAGNILDLI